MPIQVGWYDQATRIIQCDVIGDWDAESFDDAYRQMFALARKVNDKVGLICDLRQAAQMTASEYTLPVIGSSFVGLTVFVTEETDSPTIQNLMGMIQINAPDALFSIAPDIPAAVDQANHLMSRVITNIYIR